MDSNEDLQGELEQALGKGAGSKLARFALSALGGIPVVGGVFGASADSWSEANQEWVNKVLKQWVELHEAELREIGQTLAEVILRLDKDDDQVRERVSSPEFHSLVRKCFRDWSAAESESKRVMVRNLLGNAASCSMTTDDVVRLFIDWIGAYSELHFRVIKCVFNRRGITRHGIWRKLHSGSVREDSADADLFKLVVQDLSIGHIIRQDRPVDAYGRFIKQKRGGARKASPYMKSAFDDEKPYVLTELGKQFVHYVMNDIVPKIGG